MNDDVEINPQKKKNRNKLNFWLRNQKLNKENKSWFEQHEKGLSRTLLEIFEEVSEIFSFMKHEKIAN